MAKAPLTSSSGNGAHPVTMISAQQTLASLDTTCSAEEVTISFDVIELTDASSPGFYIGPDSEDDGCRFTITGSVAEQTIAIDGCGATLSVRFDIALRSISILLTPC